MKCLLNSLFVVNLISRLGDVVDAIPSICVSVKQFRAGKCLGNQVFV